jgi:hypothetical protein
MRSQPGMIDTLSNNAIDRRISSFVIRSAATISNAVANAAVLALSTEDSGTS